MGRWCRRLGVALIAAALLGSGPHAEVAQASTAAGPGDPALSVDPAEVHAAMECRGPAGGGGREPVLLVHGTTMTGSESFGWNYLPWLAEHGYRVCTVDLPARSLGDIQHAAEFVVVAVHRLARESGRKVDVLGHSQGALEARWAVRWWPSVQAEVDDLVSLAGPNQGTTVPLGGTDPAPGCPACAQMAPGSAFLTALNSGDQTPGAVSFTSLYSTLVDELITPNATAARIEGASNIELQRLCAARVVTHGSIVIDAAAFAMAIDAFNQAGAAAPARFDPAICLQATFFPLPAALLDALLQPIAVPAGGTRTAEPPLKPYAQQAAARPSTTGATPTAVGPPATKANPDATTPVATARPGTSTPAPAPSVADTSTPPTQPQPSAAPDQPQPNTALAQPQPDTALAQPARSVRFPSGQPSAIFAALALALVTTAAGHHLLRRRGRNRV